MMISNDANSQQTLSAIGYHASMPPTVVFRATKTCEICLEVITLDLFTTTPKGDACTHQEATSCVSCVRAYIEAQADSSTSLEIRCPEPQCKGPIDYNHMRLYAPAEIFTRYDDYLNQKALQNTADFIPCANVDCSFGGTVDILTTTYMVCTACNTKTCTTCKTPWHPERTHAQNTNDIRKEAEEAEQRIRNEARRASEERASNREVEAISKACPSPGCGVRIEKNQGCDHMTCKSAPSSNCLTPLRSILTLTLPRQDMQARVLLELSGSPRSHQSRGQSSPQGDLQALRALAPPLK
jgi:hypothetical protein